MRNLKSRTFLTPADVAKRFGVTTDTVRWWADTGKLKISERSITGRRMFRLDDVEAFAKERAKKGGAQ